MPKKHPRGGRRHGRRRHGRRGLSGGVSDTIRRRTRTRTGNIHGDTIHGGGIECRKCREFCRARSAVGSAGGGCGIRAVRIVPKCRARGAFCRAQKCRVPCRRKCRVFCRVRGAFCRARKCRVLGVVSVRFGGGWPALSEAQEWGNAAAILRQRSRQREPRYPARRSVSPGAAILRRRGVLPQSPLSCGEED